MQRKILGQSKATKSLLDMIDKVAAAKTNILVIGESGTGKELVARMLHEHSPLKGKPFVPVNCGAIPENLIESEMFGHKKGSFTGAVMDRPGLFEAANGGSLFLDEVGELPLNMQVKLLRAIQERVFRKVGGNEDIRVDVRIIAATNRDLEAAIAAGTFREDLYYRLNVIQLRTPPLREREGDVKILAEVFLKKFCERAGKPLTGLDPDALRALETYAWPGNIRELENVMERAVTLASGTQITLVSLPTMIAEQVVPVTRSISAGPSSTSGAGAAGWLQVPAADFSAGKLDLEKILGDIEQAYLTAALAHTQGVKKQAAELLGITFRSIRYRLKKLGIEDSGDE